MSHNHEATVACMHLAAMPSPPTEFPLSVTAAGAVNNKASQRASTRLRSATGTNSSKKYDANELRHQHADEHGNVGQQVRLTMEDLDHLDFILQAPLGAAMDESPLHIWASDGKYSIGRKWSVKFDNTCSSSLRLWLLG
jgi:hypothetical protein